MEVEAKMYESCIFASVYVQFLLLRPFCLDKKGMPTTPPVGDEHTNVASGVAQATPRRGCLLAAQGEQRYFPPKLSISIMVTDNFGRLLSFIRLGDNCVSQTIFASLSHAIVAVNQHFVDGSPFE